MKKIQANAELRKKMQRVFKVTNANLSQVLSYQSDSAKAKKMRLYALANGATKLVSEDELSDND